MGDAADGEVEHLAMTKNFYKGPSKPKRAIASTCRIALTALEQREQGSEAKEKEGDADKGCEVGDRTHRIGKEAQRIGIHAVRVGLTELSTGFSTSVESYTIVI